MDKYTVAAIAITQILYIKSVSILQSTMICELPASYGKGISAFQGCVPFGILLRMALEFQFSWAETNYKTAIQI